MKKSNKPAFFSEFSREGIYARFFRAKSEIHLYGCFDSFCYLDGERIPLKEFFDRVGITEKDCRRAFKQP